jgi:hypothetical protein
MSTSPTPGPYHVSSECHFSDGDYISVSTYTPEGERMIALVKGKKDSPESMARAVLFAEAPGLLEACKMALNGMNALVPELKSGTDACAIAALNIDRLEHAICEAEGSSTPD